MRIRNLIVILAFLLVIPVIYADITDQTCTRDSTCPDNAVCDCPVIAGPGSMCQNLMDNTYYCMCDGSWHDCDNDDMNGCETNGACCVPSCVAKTCGADNGCGTGTCNGTCVVPVGSKCAYNFSSDKYSCCTPNCAGKTCGSDGCGGVCPPNNCAASGRVCYNGNCCAPSCSGVCEDNNCGGTCSFVCPNAGEACNPYTSSCVPAQCNPECGSTTCGDSNGCGGICSCSSGVCYQGRCGSGGVPQGCTCISAFDGSCAQGSQVCQWRAGNCIASQDAGPGACVDCEYWYGEFCMDDNDCNPSQVTFSGAGTDCEDYTNYKCTGDHCCNQGEFWDTAHGRCARPLCVGTGGVASSVGECCQTPDEQYLNGTHCCPKGMFWSTTDLACRERDPCYSPLGFFSSSSYCNLVGPNIGSYGTFQMSSWFGSNPSLCLNTILSPDKACCFMNAGMYGFTAPGEQFYLWHEVGNISIY